jgi:hypothetical protein
MSVRVSSVFVLFRVQVAALRKADPPFKESYRLCIGKAARVYRGCRAIDKHTRTETQLFPSVHL